MKYFNQLMSFNVILLSFFYLKVLLNQLKQTALILI